jgi:sigma-B regulation protein RsbU (phosphoserine phosphatase)
MSIKSYRKLYFALAALFWLLLLASNISLYFAENTFINPGLIDFFSNYLLCLFILFTFLFFKIEVGKEKLASQDDYLWRVFITGVSSILVSLFIHFFIRFFFATKGFKTDDSFIQLFTIKLTTVNRFIDLTYTILFHIHLGLITIFIASTFYVWKKLILYHKSTRTNIAWHVLEYFVLVSILSSFFIFDANPLNVFDYIDCLIHENDCGEKFQKIYFYIFTSPIIILAVALSANLKWIALLNYKKKIRSIVLMAFTLLICVMYFQQIYEQQLTNKYSIDLLDNVFIISLLVFITFYALVSLLVLMFHLPTSSVFERKIEEVKVFQKLNQSIQQGETEEHIYELLLQSGINSVEANSGWLEMMDEKGNFKAFIHQHIDKIDVFEIKKVLRKNHINTKKEPYHIKTFRTLSHNERILNLPYKSSIMLPLTSNNEFLGTLVLIKNKNNGFDKTATDVLYAFVSQASLAIKNYRLVSDALQNQRYREEVKIAKEVQKRLLPTNMMLNDHLQIHAFSKAADDVGGDYYDIYPYPGGKKVALTIGDVSGNGTTASFNMAQMKGIFQSLIQLDLPADEFMVLANRAVGACLEKTSFITLSLFNIDIENKQFEYSRAGHCQSFHYSEKDKKFNLLEQKGLGLGIVRNDSYKKHIEKCSYSFEKNDLLIMYTDGIIEASNEAGEEYGFDNLKNVLAQNVELAPKQMTDKVLNHLYEFTGKRDLNDDYSIIILKFV